MRLPTVHQILPRSANSRNRDKIRKQNNDRSFIFGTRTYGSGYDADWEPGTTEHRYIFWPLSWPPAASRGSENTAYLNVEDKYGNSGNPDRLGGPMSIATFASGETNFTIVADNFTVHALAEYIAENCTSYLSELIISNATVDIKAYDNSPLPDNVVQYYRSCSIALASNSYINNATYSAVGTPDTKMPHMTGLECFNLTIGNNAPLSIGSATGPATWLIALIVLLGLLAMSLIVMFCCTIVSLCYARPDRYQKKVQKSKVTLLD